MGKSYTGDQIVAKVRQASHLIEQGKPLREVWSSVQITRQTYNRWKALCDSIQCELESQTKEAAKQVDSFNEENRHLRSELRKVQDQAREYERQLEAAGQQLSTFSALQDQLTVADSAKKASDKIIEDLKAQLSEAEKQLQEQIATNQELQHRYEHSEEHSQRSTGQSEQGKVESAVPSDSRENPVREDDGNSSARLTSQARDGLSEDSPSKDMNLPSKDDVDDTIEEPVEVERRPRGGRCTQTPEETLSEVEQRAGGSTQGTWIAKLCRNMRDRLRERACPIGIDIQDDCITMVQLGMAEDRINLVQARKAITPYGIEPDTCDWGRWAVGAIRHSIRSGGFRNSKVCLSLPVRNTFIESVAIPGNTTDPETTILQLMQRKLPYEATPENTIIKWIPTEGSHVVAIALERRQVERCLAICDKTKLKPETFSVWPFALITSYSLLPGQTDGSFVMLLDVAKSYTNVAICRDKKLYYARTIHVGARDLESSTSIRFLVDEIDSCRAHFAKIYGERPIERSIFFVGDSVDRNTVVKIARQVGIAAQLGNPFGVMKVSDRSMEAVDDENAGSSWLVAIGLGLKKGMGQCPRARTVKEPAKPQTGRQTQVRRPIDSHQWISKMETRFLRCLILGKPAPEMAADNEAALLTLPRRVSSFFKSAVLKRACA
jgi:Tfp pilus assembly PilM family ATPase